MSVQEVNLRPCRWGSDRIALAITQAAAGTDVVLSGASVHLLAAAPPYNPNLLWADVTEATSTGAAAQVLGTVALGTDGTGRAKASYPCLSWSIDVGATSETIVAVAITDSATPPKLLFIGYLGAPVIVDRPDVALTVVPQVAIPAGNVTSWGESAIVV